MIYAQESFKEFISSTRPLIREHHWEVGIYQDEIDLNIDEDLYTTLDEAGKLRIYTWRDEKTLDWPLSMRGYSLFFVHSHPHYKDHLFASNDIVYVKPHFRHTGNTLKFFEWCEQQLVDEGVSVISYHMKEDKPFHTLMKDMLGYDHQEHIYTKYIGK